MIRVDEAEFALFSSLVREATGIALDESKVYLVETRLAPLLDKTGSRSFGELFSKIRADDSGELLGEMIDRITTQETSFFRDQAPYDMLANKILPDLVDARAGVKDPLGRIPLRIWSAACATGQEPYSIAMTVKETLGDLSKYDLRILGTDISDAALAKASRGSYTAAEVSRGLGAGRLAADFDRSGDSFRIRDELRGLVSFKRLDLRGDISRLGRWDIVFCRNVAIYFAAEEKKSLFDRIGRSLILDGALVVGTTESLLGICPQYEAKRYVRSVFYKLK
jgi:Methylase of chemotaxis methyl-accepting proteins